MECIASDAPRMALGAPLELLEAWAATPARPVRRGQLKSNPALQPRDESLAPIKDRYRLQERSAEHVSRLRAVLDASASAELDPLLIAEVEGVLYVVDGHHRLRAYRAAGRECIPARVLRTTWESAVVVSKVVNSGGVKLPLHLEQSREAAWQYLAHATRRGSRPLSATSSTRSIGALFALSPDTVSRMCRRIPQVDPRDYSAEACDPGTGWPRWRHVRGNSHRIESDALDIDARTRWRIERCAVQISRLRDKAGADIFEMAIQLLNSEPTVLNQSS